jgi:hypothetical protein
MALFLAGAASVVLASSMAFGFLLWRAPISVSLDQQFEPLSK